MNLLLIVNTQKKVAFVIVTFVYLLFSHLLLFTHIYFFRRPISALQTLSASTFLRLKLLHVTPKEVWRLSARYTYIVVLTSDFMCEKADVFNSYSVNCVWWRDYAHYQTGDNICVEKKCVSIYISLCSFRDFSIKIMLLDYA